MTTFGVDTVLVAGVVIVLAAVAVLVLLLAPWRSVRDERPLDTDTETRLLLGEDPARVAADLDAAGTAEPVGDAPPGPGDDDR